MGWKRLIIGEPMPDKNDPKYKERYEREVEWGAKKIQEIGQTHKMVFLVLVFGFVMLCFFVNVYHLVNAYQHSGPMKAVAIERVDSAMQHRYDR